MKKILGFLLSLCIMLGACVGCGYYLISTGYVTALTQSVGTLFRDALQPYMQGGGAQTPTPEADPQTPVEQQPPVLGPGYDEEGRLVDPDEALYALLYDAATNFTDEVDIAHLGYTAATLEAEISRFFFTHPELFYVDTGYSIYTEQGSTAVKRIRLRYLSTPTQAQAQLLFYNALLDEVVAGIPAGASDFDKALYLHDYLVRNYAYDYEGLAEETATGESVAVRDAYTFFYGKVGVCQAYMLAYIALCEEAGISCLPVTSDEMQHAWNLVKLDGEWYHVDVTWDDAGGEQSAVYPSYISYKYFLLSGEALYATGRTAIWQTSESAADDKYDAVAWRKATTPMCKNGADYFCVIYNSAPQIYRGTPTQMTAVATLNTRWYSTYPSYYTQAFASIVECEGVMVVSTATGFLYYNMTTHALSEALDLSDSLGDKQIFGICGIDADGVISFVVAADYRGEFSVQTRQIQIYY